MNICFITGNQGKFLEIAAIIPGLERIDLDLPEIQSLDPDDVIGAKLKEAARQHPELTLLVEDTSLYLACLGGFPGPLIKWFLQAIGCPGIADLCARYANFAAWTETVIGMKHPGQDNPVFFRGRLNGRIVAPEGSGGFGWDPIFVPEGENRSLAAIKSAHPGAPAMRREAATLAAAYLRDSIVQA